MQNRCVPIFHLYLEISQWQHPCPHRTTQPVLPLQPLWCWGLLHWHWREGEGASTERRLVPIAGEKKKKRKKNQVCIYSFFLTQACLFPWQHPESGVSLSAVWWHRVPRCQQHACGGREMDGKLQSLPKSYNKYYSSNSKPSRMLCLPAWFKYSLNCAILSLLLGRHLWRSGETFYLMQYSKRENRVFIVRKVLEM